MKIYLFEGKANMCGENVKKYRVALKLSQSDLAARLQTMDVLIEQKAISRIEVGDRVVADYELVALSKALGVSIYDLLGLPESSAKQRHIKQK